MSESTTPETSEIFKYSAVSLILSIIANLIIFFIGDSQDEFTTAINPLTDKPIASIDVAMTTITFLVLGTVVFFIFRQSFDDFQNKFKITGIIVALVSLTFPLNIEDIATSSIVYLDIMHLVTAIIYIYLMTHQLK